MESLRSGADPAARPPRFEPSAQELGEVRSPLSRSSSAGMEAHDEGSPAVDDMTRRTMAGRRSCGIVSELR